MTTWQSSQALFSELSWAPRMKMTVNLVTRLEHGHSESWPNKKSLTLESWKQTNKAWVVVEFQPIWKICAKSNWVHLPQFFGVKIQQNIFETSHHLEAEFKKGINLKLWVMSRSPLFLHHQTCWHTLLFMSTLPGVRVVLWNRWNLEDLKIQMFHPFQMNELTSIIQSTPIDTKNNIYVYTGGHSWSGCVCKRSRHSTHSHGVPLVLACCHQHVPSSKNGATHLDKQYVRPVQGNPRPPKTIL